MLFGLVVWQVVVSLFTSMQAKYSSKACLVVAYIFSPSREVGVGSNRSLCFSQLKLRVCWAVTKIVTTLKRHRSEDTIKSTQMKLSQPNHNLHLTERQPKLE